MTDFGHPSAKRSLEEKILSLARQYELFQPGEAVLIAVSGGPDSVALLLALLRLAPDLGLGPLAAAHFNHGVRETSDADERFVAQLCRRMEVPLAGGIRLEGAAPGNLEQSLRRDRYRFLLAEATRLRARLATGHTLDDQAETVLMKMARGAGVRGAGGIYPKRRLGDPAVTVVRPLLDVTKEEVLAYLASQNQEYCQDLSNTAESLDRNWIRRQLLPLMVQRLNPRVKENLSRSAQLFQEVTAFLEEEGRRALKLCQNRRDGADLILSLPQILELPIALRRQVVREATAICRGSLAEVTRRHVQNALDLTVGASGHFTRLPGGWRVIREFDTLRWTRGEPTGNFSVELSIPGDFYVKEVAKRVRVRQTAPDSIAADAIGLSIACNPLTVRNRRPGDWLLSPSGRALKLKDAFQQLRVPLSERDRRLVLEQCGRVVAVEGIGAAADCRPGAADPTAFEVRIENATLPDALASNNSEESGEP